MTKFASPAFRKSREISERPNESFRPRFKFAAGHTPPFSFRRSRACAIYHARRYLRFFRTIPRHILARITLVTPSFFLDVERERTQLSAFQRNSARRVTSLFSLLAATASFRLAALEFSRLQVRAARLEPHFAAKKRAALASRGECGDVPYRRLGRSAEVHRNPGSGTPGAPVSLISARVGGGGHRVPFCPREPRFTGSVLPVPLAPPRQKAARHLVAVVPANPRPRFGRRSSGFCP